MDEKGEKGETQGWKEGSVSEGSLVTVTAAGVACEGWRKLAEMRIEGNIGTYRRKANEAAERGLVFPFQRSGRPFRRRVRNAVEHPRSSLNVRISMFLSLFLCLYRSSCSLFVLSSLISHLA